MAEELKEIRWFNFSDGKMHSCKIGIKENELDFNVLLEAIENIIKNNEDKCKSIYFLGLAMTGSNPGARGFLDGWLARSLKDKMEEEQGKWNILHEAIAMTKDEIKSQLVKGLREAADKLENEDEFDPKNAPVVKNRDDGTELFS